MYYMRIILCVLYEDHIICIICGLYYMYYIRILLYVLYEDYIISIICGLYYMYYMWIILYVLYEDYIICIICGLYLQTYIPTIRKHNKSRETCYKYSKPFHIASTTINTRLILCLFMLVKHAYTATPTP